MCKIGVIDSGAGGISTLSSLIGLLPDQEYIYVSDRSHSPYGGKDADFIFERMSEICFFLQSEGAAAVVIACNTATSAAIQRLRAEKAAKDAKTANKAAVFGASGCAFTDMFFVGMEPAILPAVQELTFGKALILATPFTVTGQKLENLLGSVAAENVIISPQPQLAPLIESNLNDLGRISGQVERLLCPLAGEHIESVVLGCTHYCLIKRQIAQIFNAKIYDGNAGTAVRLYHVLKQNGLINRKGSGSIRFVRL